MFTSSTKKNLVCRSSYWVLLQARKMFNVVRSTIKEEPNNEFINGLTNILCVCLPFVLMLMPNLYEDMENYLTNVTMFIYSMNKMLWKISMFFKCKCMHIGQPMTNNNGRKVPILVQKQSLDLDCLPPHQKKIL